MLQTYKQEKHCFKQICKENILMTYYLYDMIMKQKSKQIVLIYSNPREQGLSEKNMLTV